MAEPERRERRIEIIANPATRTSAVRLFHLLSRWHPPLSSVRIHFTERDGDAERWARSLIGTADIMVAAGGDGTVGAVATALARTGVPLGIIPTGSTNIIAKELGIPSRQRDALRLILGEHRLATIDVGMVNGRAMLHMAGAGFDSRLFALTSSGLKKRVGWIAYLPASIRALVAGVPRLHVVADGEEFRLRTPMVLVANGSSVISSRFRIDSEPAVDDGWLDLFIVSGERRFAVISSLFYAMRGGLGASPSVIYRRVQNVSIVGDDVPYQVDGDVIGPLPVTITADPLALRVIVPPA